MLIVLVVKFIIFIEKLVGISLLFSLTLFATNGDNLIDFDAKSRALGRTGIANFVASSNVFSNPALIGELISINLSKESK